METLENLVDIDREKIIKEVFWILNFINPELWNTLSHNINIWSTKELHQIWSFLQTGDLSPLYLFIEDKKNEYLDLVSQLKRNQRLASLETIKLSESFELKKEKQEIENIEFNF